MRPVVKKRKLTGRPIGPARNEYVLPRTLLTYSGGVMYAVTLPKWLVESKGWKAGNTIQLRFGNYPSIIIEKQARQSRKER